MPILKQAPLDGADLSEPRGKFLDRYVTRLEDKLRDAYPADAGYHHDSEWAMARCVDTRKHSQQIQDTCHSTRIHVSKGAKWGVGAKVYPKDVEYKWVRVNVEAAAPVIVNLKRYIFGFAAGVGVLAGIISLIATVAHGSGAKLAAMIVGLMAFAIVAFVGLVFISPLRYLMGLPLRADVDHVGAIVEETWREMQMTTPQLEAMTGRRNPVLVYAVGFPASAVGTVTCLMNLGNKSASMGTALGFGALVLGIVAVAMFCGLVGTEFGLIE